MIGAEIIADSLSPQGDRLTTYKVVFPRYILAELNTHRAFSRNSASSRAIPFDKMVNMVKTNPFVPIAWQKDHKGMQGTQYIEDSMSVEGCEMTWLTARDVAVGQSMMLNKGNNVTKQFANRLLEPFMWHTVILTSSEEGLENFFNLRCPQYEIEGYRSGTFRSRKDAKSAWDGKGSFPTTDLGWHKDNSGQADIHIMALAEAMWDCYSSNTPKQLEPGDWHIPFGDNISSDVNDWDFLDESVVQLWGKDMVKYHIKVAIARCARISYQTLGDNPVINYEKDLKLYDRLSTSGHWSPFEHVAQAMDNYQYYSRTNSESQSIEQHRDGTSTLVFEDCETSYGWCRNYKGFIQTRATLD